MKKTVTLVGNFDFDVPLENLIQDLINLKDKYSDFFDLRFDKDYSEDYSHYNLIGDREETKQEIALRKQVEQNRLNARKEQVRKEAEKLGLL